MVSNQAKIILTKDGFFKIKTKLKSLEEVERKKVADDMRDAQSFGDIAENSEFEEARTRQELLEQEIAELKHILSQAIIVSPQNSRGKITIGSKVKVRTDHKTEVYEIVGDREANPQEYKISYRSPWGQAMLGKAKGEKVEVFTPRGPKILHILEIS